MFRKLRQALQARRSARVRATALAAGVIVDNGPADFGSHC